MDVLREPILQRLKDPPKKYRPVPFWSWNERLNVETTRWQIEEMDKAGMGGYFMHARGGLMTEYMGAQWMDNIRAGLDEARRRGMSAWGYDENGWPSGFGNGIVNGLGLSYQQKYLRFERLERPVFSERTITCIDCDGGVLHFYYDVNPFYVDTLDPRVTEAFLSAIHERYKAELGDDFAGLAGFFTDEPQISRNGIPWSFVLPQAYKEAYGEELLPRLSELFFREGLWTRTRVRFWSLVRDLFVEGYMKRIYEWCEKNGTRLTGHMVLEDSLESQLASNGACMPNYEYMHIPGIDLLCRRLGSPLLPLQISSVAQQLGKRQVLSETFALCGWDVSFEELRWLYEWQMARGINLLCQHLEGYSLRGIRKRDYPASLFYQQPWWDEYRAFNDAMSRIGMLLCDGDPQVGVLLLHPQSSAWVCYDDGQNVGLSELDRDFLSLIKNMEAAQIPFHLGDERIMARHGAVKGTSLAVGQMRYAAAVVPPMRNISEAVLALIEAFRDVGGQVIFTGKPPELVDGEPSERPSAFAARCTRADIAGAAEALPETVRPVRVEAAPGEAADLAVTVRRFDSEGLTVYYLVNSADRAFDARIHVPRGASAARLEPLTGEEEGLSSAPCGDGLCVDHRFLGMDSLVLLVYDEKREPARAREPGGRPLEGLEGTWEIAGCDDNALTLDVCDYYFDGMLQGKNEPVCNIQERACALRRPVRVEMLFKVRVKKLPRSPVTLVLERPDRFTVTVNGRSAEKLLPGFYFDTSFKRVDISGLLKEGENDILLGIDFAQRPQVYDAIDKALQFESEKNKLTYDDEIEAVYLTGRFGVGSDAPYRPAPRRALLCDGGFFITALPERVQSGDITSQGFPFFAGRIRLRRTFRLSAGELEGRVLRFSQRCAAVTSVSVNGTAAGKVFWKPYEVPLDGLLSEGENTVEIELCGTLRNLLGPHHVGEECYEVHPGCFFETSPLWAGGRNKKWSDAYCFVQFGLFLA